MLTPFGTDIWTVDGADIVAFVGFHYPTRMSVIRLGNGGLFIWSPVALAPGLKEQIDALGPVEHLVAPNALHHMSLGPWAAAYPKARVYAPPGLRKKRPDIGFDRDLEVAGDWWPGEIDHLVVPGNAITHEVVFFHRASGTALFTDLLQQMPPGWFSGWRAIVARLDLMTAPEPMVPRKFRVAFTNRAAAREAVARILEWPVDRVLMAHGRPVLTDARGFLRRAFRWLMGRQ